MADFKTHIGTSTVIGIGYGATGYYYLGLPPATCGLAAGLCSVAGMLPDLDSDSGVPVRETVSFAAAIVPMLMIDRFTSLGMTHESIALAGAVIYLVVRFGIGGLFKRYTVHRGMWHSIPAALTASLLAFLACSCEDINARLFKASAVGIGFVSHLLLDELWSVSFKWFFPRLKKSSGTAFKLWGDNRWANFSAYAKLILLIVLALGDPLLMQWLGYHDHGLPQFANKWVTDLRERTENVVR